MIIFFQSCFSPSNRSVFIFSCSSLSFQKSYVNFFFFFLIHIAPVFGICCRAQRLFSMVSQLPWLVFFLLWLRGYSWVLCTFIPRNMAISQNSSQILAWGLLLSSVHCWYCLSFFFTSACSLWEDHQGNIVWLRASTQIQLVETWEIPHEAVCGNRKKPRAFEAVFLPDLPLACCVTVHPLLYPSEPLLP